MGGRKLHVEKVHARSVPGTNTSPCLEVSETSEEILRDRSEKGKKCFSRNVDVSDRNKSTICTEDRSTVIKLRFANSRIAAPSLSNSSSGGFRSTEAGTRDMLGGARISGVRASRRLAIRLMRYSWLPRLRAH